jgi:hypothetical protein
MPALDALSMVLFVFVENISEKFVLQKGDGDGVQSVGPFGDYLYLWFRETWMHRHRHGHRNRMPSTTMSLHVSLQLYNFCSFEEPPTERNVQ